VQGIAAAIVAPASLALIGATYPRDERNRAVGIWAAASALTTAGGPVLGGWLTDTFGWPSVFWINPPLALIAVGILLVVAPEDRRMIVVTQHARQTRHAVIRIPAPGVQAGACIR
jgi:MFS family permease